MARVLIAEPSKTLAALVKLSLAELGVELEVTHDGASALAAARTRLPDALVADQALPGLDGYALAHGVKQLASERKKTVPTLLLVSEHTPPDPERLAYVGISDVLPKPFERAVLLERVRALLDGLLTGAPATASQAGLTGVAAGVHPSMLPVGGYASSHAHAPMMLPPTAPSPRPGAMPASPPPEIEWRGMVEAQIEATLGPILAAKLPAMVDAAISRILPGLVTAAAEKALEGRVAPLVDNAVRRTLGELATPTTIQRIVSDDAKNAVADAVGRIESRVESELLERLDRFAREVLPGRLQAQAEQVIWKIVPTLAEDIIKDEIKRLTQEHP